MAKMPPCQEELRERPPRATAARNRRRASGGRRHEGRDQPQEGRDRPQGGHGPVRLGGRGGFYVLVSDVGLCYLSHLLDGNANELFTLDFSRLKSSSSTEAAEPGLPETIVGPGKAARRTLQSTPRCPPTHPRSQKRGAGDKQPCQACALLDFYAALCSSAWGVP